jgi:adhesin/invasin
MRRALCARGILLVVTAACSDDSAGPTAAGPISAAHAEVTASATSVASASAVTLTLRARDAQGRDLGHGGSTVVFTPGGGGSTGTVSGTLDRGDGSYEASFTGVIAGSATAIGALIDGVPVTTPLPAIRVTPGAFSAATSTITVTPRTVLPGGVAMVELISRDAAGNALDKGGLDVELHVAGGSSVGIVGPVTDHGDGRYTAAFTASNPGTPLGVTAEVNGAPLESPPPTVTVARGISLENSLLTVPFDSVTIGSGMRVTLELRDSSNVARTSGGDTVVFSVSGVAGGNAMLDDFVDHDDGTYTANLTATHEGVVTIGVRINGRDKADLPTVAIEKAPVTAQKSTVAVTTETIVAGDTTTFTAELRDLNGAPVTSADLRVEFTLSNDGTSSGAIGPARYEGSGIWSATFTAEKEGTRVRVGATIDDSTEIQMLDSLGNSHLPFISVIPGEVSADSSQLTADPPFINVGDTATIVLVTRDAYGNALTSGDHAVSFSRMGGPGASVGRILEVIDHGNGRYTAAYVGDSVGTQDVIAAAIDGHSVTSTLPAITVGPSCTPGPLSLSSSDLTINDTTSARVPVKALTLPSGVTTTLTIRVRDALDCPIAAFHAVAVTASGGQSTGVTGETVDLGDGRHVITWTGHTSGAAVTLTATVDGQPLSSTPVTVAVVPGDISTQTSLVTLSNSALAVGATGVIVVQARDGARNLITTGGRSLTFAVAGSGGGVVFGPTTDNHNGTYSATYTATTGGTRSIVAYIDGTPIVQRPVLTVSP